MYARNPKTGAAITGTLEQVDGRATTIYDSFQREESGKLAFEHGSETQMYWDGQETQTRDGQVIFIDDDGEEVLENDVELTTKEEPRKTPKGAALTF